MICNKCNEKRSIFKHYIIYSQLAKTGHGPHSSKIVVLFYVLFVLYHSMYCLCVNVYCTAATG